MLYGAIVGLVAGLVAFLVLLVRNRGRLAKIMGPFDAGDADAARRALDALAPPRDAIQNLRDTLALRERWAALALMNDPARLAAEVAALRGPDKVVPYAKNLGFLALALVGPQPADAVTALAALVAACESGKAGKHTRRALTILRAQLAVARGLTGEAVEARSLALFRQTHFDSGLVQRFAQRVLERVTPPAR